MAFWVSKPLVVLGTVGKDRVLPARAASSRTAAPGRVERSLDLVSRSMDDRSDLTGIPMNTSATFQQATELAHATGASALRFFPWEGGRYRASPYENVRLLLLGESMYEKTPQSLTPDIVRTMVDRIRRGVWAIRFYTQVFQTVTGTHRRAAHPNTISTFWDSVAFYNYVQFSVGDRPRMRPRKADWGASQSAFRSVVKQLNPQAVLVFGRELWNQLLRLGLLQAREGRTGHLTCGQNTAAAGINHPASRGYSWRTLHPFVLGWLRCVGTGSTGQCE